MLIDMDRNKFSFSSLISRLCAVVLAVLGFSCSSEVENSSLCMYGTPTGSFEAKGAVTDEEGKPVMDAEIKITEKYVPSSDYSIANALTNANGIYEAEGRCLSDSLKVVCLPADKSLEPDSLYVKLEYKHDKVNDKKYKNAWMYIGNASFTADFKLKRKKQ